MIYRATAFELLVSNASERFRTTLWRDTSDPLYLYWLATSWALQAGLCSLKIKVPFCKHKFLKPRTKKGTQLRAAERIT